MGGRDKCIFFRPDNDRRLCNGFVYVVVCAICIVLLFSMEPWGKKEPSKGMNAEERVAYAGIRNEIFFLVVGGRKKLIYFWAQSALVGMNDCEKEIKIKRKNTSRYAMEILIPSMYATIFFLSSNDTRVLVDGLSNTRSFKMGQWAKAQRSRYFFHKSFFYDEIFWYEQD